MMKDVRKLFPLNAVNEFLIKVSTLFGSRLNEHASSPSMLPDNVIETIKSAVEIGSGLSVRRMTDSVFVVTRVGNGEKRRVVNISEKTCTCKWYQEHGIPCYHACAVMLKHGIPAEDFCLDVVKTETLVRLYSGTVLPIDSDDLEEVTIIPPEVPKKIGRPRGKRIKNHLEKSAKENRCSLCGTVGHNKRTCPGIK